MSDWRKVFEEHGAIWVHDKNPKRPHALLTSGMHSDGFVNCTKVTQHPDLLQRILSEPNGLASRLPEQVDWVIGSALGAVTFAYAVAGALKVRAGFTEKDGEAMKLARFEVAPNEKVLVVEDTISTGGSTLKTIEGIIKSGVSEKQILPYIVCLVNRSGSGTLNGRELRALLTLDIHMWQAEQCPLCKEGSAVVRPKSHWHELTKKL